VMVGVVSCVMYVLWCDVFDVGVLFVKATEDCVHGSVKGSRDVFRDSGSDGEVTSLVDVECNDNDVGDVVAGEEKGLDAAVMIGHVRKKM